jgi:hypothetical protein
MPPTIQLKVSSYDQSAATSRPRCSKNQMRQPLLSVKELSATTTQNLELRFGSRQANLDSASQECANKLFLKTSALSGGQP